MKKLLIIVCIATLFINCNNNGGLGGGGWSAAEKQKGLKACMDQIEGQLDNATAKKFCNCALEKAMKKWKTYAESETVPDDDPAANEIGRSCMTAIQGGGGGEDNPEDNGGGKGKKKGGGLFGGGGDGGEQWSNADRQKFMNTCLQNAMNAGADRQTSNAHCECTLKKMAKKYSSYADADRNLSKEEMNTMEQECIAENNNGGNDGNDDDN